MVMTEVEDRQRVLPYRRRYPEADRWADGVGHVSHSPLTQELVFHLAEQPAGRGVDRVE